MQQLATSVRRSEATVGRPGPGQILSGVFATFERAGIAYCVLHGYETYPDTVPSDVDCIISTELPIREITALFHTNRAEISADLVGLKGACFTFAGKHADGSPCFLTLDLSFDCAFGNLIYYSGGEVVANRKRYKQFWIPTPDIEFGCYLTRRIAKGVLTARHTKRLSQLYALDPRGCRQQILRFWSTTTRVWIETAAHCGDWTEVSGRLSQLRNELRQRAMRDHPWHVTTRWMCMRAGQINSLFGSRPGMIVALLGPDGAGKSSIIDALSRSLDGAFARTMRYGFAPGLLRHFRPPDGANTQPHAAPPRSWLMSVTRALCYWLGYYLLIYRPVVRLALARSTLVLHDRHLIDALVDPKRYRYAGPVWLLRAIWLLVPKPDLVILLDAPAEVLQARKREVPHAESARQRAAYIALIRSLDNGYVIDSSRDFPQVLREIEDLVVNYLAGRFALRLKLTELPVAPWSPDRYVRSESHTSLPGGGAE
jgi:thymidylate kinase